MPRKVSLKRDLSIFGITFLLVLIFKRKKCNPNDIGPQYASVIMSVANMVGNVPGFVTPKIGDYFFTNYGHTKFSWGVTYGIGGVLIIIGGIWFMIFGSGKTIPQ